MRKGQTALEYLVTYGWAILAIVIIAFVLWTFGVFTPQPTKRCSGFTSFICVDYVTSASAGTATVVLANAAGGTLDITSPAGCSVDPVAANQNTSCAWSGLTFSVGDPVSLPITFVDQRSALTHTDTGTVIATA